ncbi:MAG: acylneuraminate cytidylyltransferase family protein [Fibrobacteria bacterium]
MGGVLALIPARAGSKGLKGKNRLPLGGAPLLAYSIAAAKQSRRIDRVVFTTDGEELAGIARSYGAEVPFLRPAELAQDDTRDLPVFQHALRWLEERENWIPDIVVQLRPTSPLRKPGQIDRAVELLEGNPNATGVRTVCIAPSNPFKMWKWPVEGSPFMKNLLDVDGVKEPFNEPRQSLPRIWWQTGTIDVVRAPLILAGSMTGDRLLPLEIDAEQAEDIDNELNLIYAGLILEKGGFIRPEPLHAG